MDILLKSTKKELDKMKQKISNSGLLSSLGINILIDKEENGYIFSKIDTLKFKSEPFKNQWKALRKITNEFDLTKQI